MGAKPWTRPTTHFNPLPTRLLALDARRWQAGSVNASTQPRPPRNGSRDSSRHPGHIATGRALLILVVAVVLGVVLLRASTRPLNAPVTSSQPPAHTGKSGGHKAPASTTTTVVRSSVAVLVANGTSAANAAAHYTTQLQTQGWSMKPPTDTTTPVNVTNVYYAAGEQGAASSIAASLGIKPTAVLPLTSSVPVSGTTGVDVVVVIGPDLAGQGFPSSSG
ncbi:MAG: LytR C-terminal domain-containing protein [Acidimicrobiales bacterium]